MGYFFSSELKENLVVLINKLFGLTKWLISYKYWSEYALEVVTWSWNRVLEWHVK